MQHPPWTFAIAFASAVLAAVSAWCASAPSIAVSPDSVQYISAAQSIAGGTGFASAVTPWSGTEAQPQLLAWPPLYPAILSLGAHETAPGAHVVDPGWIRGVNVMAFVLTFLPLCWLARAVVGDPGWIFVPLWYAAFRPNYLVVSFAWPEPLLILLALTAIALTGRALSRPRGEIGNLLLLRCAGLAAGLATLCSYRGVAVLAALTITVVACSRGHGRRRMVQRVFAVSWPALVLISAWFSRNWMLTGRVIVVPDVAPSQNVGRSLLEGIHVLARDWIAPAAEPSWLAPAVTLLFAAAAFWAIWIVATRSGSGALASGVARAASAMAVTQHVWIHLAFLVVAAIGLSLEPVSTRLLAPIYPGLLLLAAGIIQATFRRLRAGQSLALMVAIAWISTGQVAATSQYLVGPRDTRSGTHPYARTVVWNDAIVQSDPSVAYLRRLPAGSLIVTNVWELVTLATGLPVKPWPDEIPGGSSFGPVLQGAYLLWNPAYRSHLPPPERWIEKRLPLRLLEEWNGVMLYRIERSMGISEGETSSPDSTQWAERSERIELE